MNNDVIKMLIATTHDNKIKCFEQELRIFAIAANYNAEIMYQEVYRLLIEEYKKDPLRNDECDYKRYRAYFNATDESDDNCDYQRNIHYLNTKGNLTQAYNNRHGDNAIIIYTCKDQNIKELYFNYQKLENMLEEDGIDITIIPSGYCVSIDALKFKELIDSVSKNKTK